MNSKINQSGSLDHSSPDHSGPEHSYLQQSEAVKNRFDRLKAREVVLEVKQLGKVYKTTKGE
ncbi:MAG: hypothetical protein Q7T42_10605, partial [Methylotenera sp.]|nr:hypothetical protein [Methylotenera sp.]